MDHQDWNEVVIRGKRTREQNLRDGNYIAETKRRVDNHTQKLDQESENFKHQKVSHNLSQAIQQARVNKGWTRKEFAQHLNVTVGVVAEYETGKAIPNNLMLQKMSRVLGIQLRKNM